VSCELSGRQGQAIELVCKTLTDNAHPPPWTLEERAAAFVVCDANGQALAHIFFKDEDKPPRRSASKLLNKNEARRIAANIVKLPGMLSNA
jgi:hypothetical protein